MGFNWTKEQKQVIESHDRNLLVSAAAGSGKTAVLVERIIRMISNREHPADIDRLLVMTFTKAAASEMRERIQMAIEKKLEEHPEDTHLQQQAVMVQYAQITTIDSFCLHILREYFDCLDIDPAFRVADEGEMLLLKSDVMESLLEDYYENGGERFERFVDTYAIGKTDGGIADYIMQVYTFSQSNPWPEEWLAECRKELEQGTIEELDQTRWMQFLLQDVRTQANEWITQLSETVKLCKAEDGPKAYLPMICEDLEQIEPLTRVNTYEELAAAAGKIAFSRLASIRSKDDTVDMAKKEAVADDRKQIKKAVEKLTDQYLFETPEQMLIDLEESKEAIFTLLELAEEYSGRFRQKKQEKNVVDFNDLEHFALEILLGEKHEPSAVADEISSQYDEILVDEYQDSNLVQEALITAISGERFGHPNVFMVGDVKQSIYKFRLARPELFLEKYHSYSSEDSDYQKIELHQNFRSRDLVLESINDVFRQIMTEKLGDIEYTEETALHPGAVFEPRENPGELETEMLLLNTGESILGNLDEDIADYTTRELEAAMIADKIRALTDERDGVTIWDKEKECYRRAEFGDIVILLRSVSGWAESFTEVLSHRGIPAFAESRTGYFDTPEVNTMLNLLAVLDNPMQDIPLAAVLKSSFGRVTDAELAHITAQRKQSDKRGRNGGLYEAVKHFAEDSNAQDEIAQKLNHMLSLLEELRQAAVYLPLHELLYRIFDKTGYYDYVSAMPAGEVRQANLDMLVEKAAAYEATSYRGVFHFIKYIERLKKYNTDFGEASVVGEQGNTVRIMSIHKSKGLEFPIVMIAGMGKLFNRQDTRGKLLIDSEFGIATDYLDAEKRLKGATLKKNVMKRRMELEALGEELRVLYVAMTRAKEKLILTASGRNMDTKIGKWKRASENGRKIPFTTLTLASSYLDWVLMTLSSSGSRIAVQNVQAEELLGNEIEEQVSRKYSKAELLDFDTDRIYDSNYRTILQASFDYTYPYADDVILNTKMSVSELKKEGGIAEDGEDAILPELIPTLPDFMEAQKKEKGGATRGTAYHRAMELLPFDKITDEQDVVDALDTLVTDGKMTGEARNLVVAGDIYRFLHSDLGKRAADAEKSGHLYREKQFVMGIPAREMGAWDSDELVLIQGIIDVYFEEDGELVLVDYKTDYAEDKETLIKRYKTQLDYYERALSQITRKTVKEKVLYSYRLGEIKMVDIIAKI
ncbi:MAG: helicase-exonuclease AddAB subunit AddA [Clostridium sp.]